MAGSRVNVTFDSETSQHLIELAKVTKQSVQKLAGNNIFKLPYNYHLLAGSSIFHTTHL
ncbi:MAG: hypothetical protein MUP39_02615 [Wolbachia endosymbiont of Homalodisca vitripennis]|nr:hypothetical protein [Wolbachia endosymbiont of Homalodisca vitripennis]